MKERQRKSSPGVAARYEEHKGEISLHMSHFLLNYLRELHEEFDGDLTTIILLGEIAHHNMGALPGQAP